MGIRRALRSWISSGLEISLHRNLRGDMEISEKIFVNMVSVWVEMFYHNP